MSVGSDSDEQELGAAPELGTYEDGPVKSSSGFWSRLFGRKRLDPESLDQKEFKKLAQLRSKERKDYFTTQASLAGIDLTKTEEGGDSDLIELATPPPAEELIKVFSDLSELPPDVQGSIDRMAIPRAELSKNLHLLARILSFEDKQRPKRKFYTPDEYARITAPGYSRKQASNKHPPRMTIPHNELFKRMRLHHAKKIYKISSFLGEGGFGGVVQARLLTKAHGPEVKKVAIKFQQLNTKADQLLIQHEASFLQFCKHPGIVSMFGGLQIRDESWIVMELLSGGTLKQAAAHPSKFEEDEIGYVAVEILEAIKYLHSHQLVHQDLKNMNIMFSTDGAIKLIDFGLAADLTNGPIISMCGSPFWMSPEMIKGEPHSYPTDIWSFTICMLELANKVPPNSANRKRALWLTATQGVGENLGLKKPGDWSEKFRSFIAAGAAYDQSKRPTAEQLLEHPFLDEVVTRKVMARKLSAIFTSNAVSASGL